MHSLRNRTYSQLALSNLYKGDVVMCQALQELLKDEIDERVTNAETGIQIDNIKKIMKGFKCTAEQAMDTLEIPQENRSLYMSKL
jgi:hypothetical protein